MNNGWPSKPLCEVCEFRNGLWKGKKPPYVHVGVIRNTNFAAGGTLDDSDIAYLDVEEKQFRTRQLKPGDIILEKSGGGPKQPVGRVVLFEQREGLFSFSNFTSVVRAKDRKVLDPTFLHRVLHWHYVSGATETMQRRSTGIRNLTFDAYKQLPVPLPALDEQKRIVAILDEAFSGIAAAVANAEKNLANARELFESHLNAVFTRKGDGWVETTLGDEIDLLTGFAFKSKQYTSSPSGIPLLRGDNIIQGCLRWEDVKRWPNAEAAEFAKYELCESDVVIAMDRTWVKAGLKFTQIKEADLPCLLVQRVARLRARQRLDSRFLLRLIGSAAFVRYVLSIQTGIGVPHISGPQIQAFKFNRPPIAQQSAIADTLDTLRAETQRLESVYRQKLEHLADLKQSILHKAFAGELSANAPVAESVSA